MMRVIRCAMAGMLLLCVLSACGLPARIAGLERQADSRMQQGEQRQESFEQAIRSPDRQADQEVPRPWLAGPARPLSRDVTLPPALRADVDTTLMFAPSRAGLPVLAERIARATGIPVRVTPDALLPQSDFLPRLDTAVSAASLPAPADAELGMGRQPLPKVLDSLAWRLGVYWRYRDGAIEIYRTETRVFDVRALTSAAQAEIRLGRSANEDGGFENASNTRLSVAPQDALAAVKARIEPFLTRAGTVTAPAGAGTSVIVTDTRDALDRVARFIEHENRTLTRRVRLMFEEVTLIVDDRDEAGIDWNLIYAGSRAAASLAGPQAQAATDAALLTLEAGGAFQGSRAILSALSRVGTVVRHTRVPILALNRRPVTHAVRTTFSYIDQVQTTALAAASADGLASALPSVSISQKEETVGTFLTIVPDAQEDGQILLSIAYDNTVAQPLKTVTFGETGSQVQIQQITIDGNGTVQQVELRPGQPVVISGFDRNEDQYERRRLGRDVPMAAGGADQAGHSRTMTLVVVSARLEEGF